MRRMRPVVYAVILIATLLTTAAMAQEIKIASLAPDGTAWMKAMRAAGDALTKQTKGRVQFKFYPGGVMGNDATVLRKIQIGQLQGGAVTMLALARVYPDSQIFGLPLLFRSHDEVDYVRTRIDPILIAGLEQHNLIVFGFVEGGFAHVMSKGPVRRLSDLRAEKVWAPEGDIITRTLLDLSGIAPVVLPLADVYTGLQTGLLTAVGVSASGAIALQWHGKTKYFTDLPFYYTAGALAIDKRTFARLSPDDQTAVRDTTLAVNQQLDRASRKDEAGGRHSRITALNLSRWVRKISAKSSAMPPMPVRSSENGGSSRPSSS